MSSQRFGGVKRPHGDDDMDNMAPPSSFEDQLAAMDEEMDLNDIMTQGIEEGIDEDAAYFAKYVF